MSSRRRAKRLKVLGNVGLALLAIVTVGFVVGVSVAPTPAPPVSSQVASYYTSPPAQREVKVISALGDSYTGGSNMGGYKLKNWTSQLAALLSNDDVEVAAGNKGFGGSGYVKRGPTEKVIGEGVAEAFNERTDFAVLFGSINDRTQDVNAVAAAADKAMVDTKALVPQARLVVVGPAWMKPEVPAAIYAIRDVVKAAAEKNGAYFIDPLAEQWFFAEPGLIGADNTHPTDEGHAYMARKMQPHFRAMLAK